MDNTPDAQELFQNARSAGEISPQTAALLSGLSARINKTMVAPVVKPTVTDQTLLCMLLDNSPSMEHHNNHKAVIEGHNMVVNALLSAKAVNSIESLTALLNPCEKYIKRTTGGVEDFQWQSLRAAPRLDVRGFIHGCSTPLYDRALETLGSVLARTKWWEDQWGVQTRSVTLLMTDGDANDGKASAKDVSKLVKDMLRMEKHQIFFMGVDCDGVDFRQIGEEMGIPKGCIDVVARDAKAIRAKFQLFSQSAVSVAQGLAPAVPNVF